MKMTGAKKQALLLTGVNSMVRAMGLFLRIWMARTLGAETLGIIELAQNAHMVAIAPLTSGLPAAISRLSAKAPEERKTLFLDAGLWLSRKISFVLIPLVWLFSPVIARALGDVRVLPSLWFSAPCILILGYSASYNGYCYGIERSELPAASEMIEQAIRLLLTIGVITFAKHLTVPWMAAVPAAATMAAEITGLFFVLCQLGKTPHTRRPELKYIWSVYNLSLPSTFSRLIQTLLRSMTSILIPLQLQKSGLTASEATAAYGMLNGMVMPVMLIPGVFTSALAMVTLPRIAKAEEHPKELKRLLRICFLTILPFAALCAAVVWSFAPIFASQFYRQAELSVLFRTCSFMVILFPVNHLLGSTLSALGQQKHALWVSTLSAAATLAITFLLAANPSKRLVGVIEAQYAGQMISVLLSCFALHQWKKRKGFKADDKFF